jgi:hypothetical protein
MQDEKGRFVKGNPGKPKGATHERTRQWEALADSIIGEQADRFRAFLNELWESDDIKDKMRASELYLQTLEYFKPKQARVTHAGDADAPVQIIVPEGL